LLDRDLWQEYSSPIIQLEHDAVATDLDVARTVDALARAKQHQLHRQVGKLIDGDPSIGEATIAERRRGGLDRRHGTVSRRIQPADAPAQLTTYAHSNEHRLWFGKDRVAGIDRWLATVDTSPDGFLYELQQTPLILGRHGIAPRVETR
jgi:hypothetical protein